MRLLLLNFTLSSKSTRTLGTCLLTGSIIITLTQHDSGRKLLAQLLLEGLRRHTMDDFEKLCKEYEDKLTLIAKFYNEFT